MAKQAIRIAFALLLALACAQAWALGLGQIQVKSKANQPLLAEIPIVSNDPAELEQLQARLASPETFARIGLEPPQGAVADLQFTIVRDNSGGLAIRVTSTKPIDQPMLTFLIEVEWGQGKLVREYSALVDPPRDAPSPSAPLIDTPQTAVADMVSRPAESPAIDAAPTELAPEQPKPTETAPEAVAAQPAEAPPPAAAIAVAPQPPAPTPSPDEAAAAVPPAQDGLGPVRAGQTLSEIAVGLKPPGYTLDQTMLALLRTNPDAFIGNDINKLKRGAVLRAPGSDEIAKLGAAEAAVIVRDQIEQWRRARQERAQAASIAAMANPATGEAPRTATAQKTPAVAGARLEIIPPAADRAGQAGTRSGASAGGEGDMLRQQQELQTTKETLAARDAEVQELKSRLADLEKLQQQQQQLITLKDSELAAAQQRLTQSNQAAAKPPVATAQAQTKAETAPAQADSGTALWLGGGLLLVLIGLVGWWLARRGRRIPAPKSARPMTDSAALAASMPNAAAIEPEVPTLFAASASPAAPASRGNGAAASASAASAPTWHGATTASAANGELRIGHERIELARAYMDLGDHDTARGLLQEIVQVGDPDARAEAVRLLQDLPR
jgi:pilus assembly protein FimV